MSLLADDFSLEEIRKEYRLVAKRFININEPKKFIEELRKKTFLSNYLYGKEYLNNHSSMSRNLSQIYENQKIY